MNRNFIYILLAMPHMAFSMDWAANLLRTASNYSPGSPSSLPTSQLNQNIPLPVIPSSQPSVQDQTNNNNNQELTDPHHLIKSLRNTLFLEKLYSRLTCESKITVDLTEMSNAVIKFKEDLIKYAPSLKGPDFYILQNHIFELQTALGEDGVITHQPSLQDIEKTIDQYVENPECQQETLKYSFYLSPNNLLAPIPLSYLNFFSATHEYIKTLQKQSCNPLTSLSKTCDILNTQFEILKQQPNIVLTGNSKLATFARLCLGKFALTNSASGMFQFDTYNAKEILNKWQALIPEHIGIEAAWGCRYNDLPTVNDFYQEDRGAIYTSKEYDCYALFDGHGGSQAAQYCSDQLINIIGQQKDFSHALLSGDEKKIELCIENAFNQCNSELDSKFTALAGTTALLAFIPHNASHGFIAQLGDSEGYIINGNECISLTPYLHNTKNPSEVDRIKKEHGEDAIVSGRVGSALLITRALGNLPRLRKFLSTKPTISKFSLKKGSICLLGTDGVFEEKDRIKTIAPLIRYYQNAFSGEIATHVMNKLRPCTGDNKMLMVIKLDPYVSPS